MISGPLPMSLDFRALAISSPGMNASSLSANWKHSIALIGNSLLNLLSPYLAPTPRHLGKR